MKLLHELEKIQGKKFGDTEDPLLVSVRSGARASMPGMMDTILNLGLNDVAVEGFAKKTGNPRFAYDSYRRFIQMYSDVVMEVPKSFFEKIIDELKEAKGVHYDTELTTDDLKELVKRFKADLQRQHERRRVPSGSEGTAAGSRKGCIPFLGQPPRHRIPSYERHPRRLGHCGKRTGYGIR